ncbi:MAG: superoxide dismutase [Chloroflexi bacterium]|nr:superoxide dismutase [Chloroflexota bacterium]
MKILALEHEYPNLSAADFQPHLEDEARQVWELQQKGVIREIYFRDDQPSAVLILECADVEEAEKILTSLPLVREKLIHFELIPLRAYPGFERLFESDSHEAQ